MNKNNPRFQLILGVGFYPIYFPREGLVGDEGGGQMEITQVPFFQNYEIPLLINPVFPLGAHLVKNTAYLTCYTIQICVPNS